MVCWDLIDFVVCIAVSFLYTSVIIWHCIDKSSKLRCWLRCAYVRCSAIHESEYTVMKMIHDAETISMAECDFSNPSYALGERVSG